MTVSYCIAHLHRVRRDTRTAPNHYTPTQIKFPSFRPSSPSPMTPFAPLCPTKQLPKIDPISTITPLLNLRKKEACLSASPFEPHPFPLSKQKNPAVAVCPPMAKSLGKTSSLLAKPTPPLKSKTIPAKATLKNQNGYLSGCCCCCCCCCVCLPPLPPLACSILVFVLLISTPTSNSS